jgi:hypothetical protein
MTTEVKIKHPFDIYPKDIAVYAVNTEMASRNRKFKLIRRLEPGQEAHVCIYDTQSIVLVEVSHDDPCPNLND